MRKVTTSTIKRTRSGISTVKSTENESLSDFFVVEYDKEYPKNHILYADVIVTMEKISDSKIVSQVLFKGRRIVTTNEKRELHRAKLLWQKTIPESFMPGKIIISNGNDSGKANIPHEFID